VRSLVGLPKLADQFQAFFENSLIILEGHMERQIFALVVAAAGGEIDAAARQEIERRPLLGNADRMMQGQHIHCGREPQPRRMSGDIGEHHVRAGQHAERVEVMLADPGRMHADLFGVKRLGGDVGDELVGRAGIVFVMVVAQREIAEFHLTLPCAAPCAFLILLSERSGSRKPAHPTHRLPPEHVAAWRASSECARMPLFFCTATAVDWVVAPADGAQTKTPR